MKLRDLEIELKKLGWYIISEKGKHTKWGNGKGVTNPVPRHTEINENLARSIIKKAQENPGVI
jgi:predicted RNA binding protein YcfA (HicA-like mRNA interferase family)